MRPLHHRLRIRRARTTALPDATPPPAPTNLRVTGNQLAWQAEADLESGVAGFIIERDGKEIAKLPEQPKNPFGRPIFQGLQYSDTPTQPLVPMTFTDKTAEPGKQHTYRIISVNTARPDTCSRVRSTSAESKVAGPPADTP